MGLLLAAVCTGMTLQTMTASRYRPVRCTRVLLQLRTIVSRRRRARRERLEHHSRQSHHTRCLRNVRGGERTWRPRWMDGAAELGNHQLFLSLAWHRAVRRLE